MGHESKKEPMMYRFRLDIIDNDGNPSSAEELAEILEEYDFSDSNPLLSVATNNKDDAEYLDSLLTEDEKLTRRKHSFRRIARGSRFDMKKSLIKIARKANDSQKGMTYDEEKRAREIVDKIEATEYGEYVLFDKGEFNTLSEKVKKPEYLELHDAFAIFRERFLEAEKVEVEPKKKETTDANTSDSGPEPGADTDQQ